jgi:hypothetical protein
MDFAAPAYRELSIVPKISPKKGWGEHRLRTSRHLLPALSDLGDRSAAAADGVLDVAIGGPGGQHGRDAGVAAPVLGATDVLALGLGLRLGLSLHLSTAPAAECRKTDFRFKVA